MAAISQKIPNLIGGVSQQPDSLKLPGQLRSCTNYYPDPTFGLAKRPGLKGVSRLTNAASGGSWFNIFRDEEEKYILQFTSAGALRIWDINSGAEQTVNTPAASATAYAVHSDPKQLDILQINDYTFVLNREITVAENTGDVTAALTPFVMVVVNTVAYDTTYTITLNSTNFSYSTPTTSGSSLNVGTIVSNLVSTINANPSWSATGIGNAIYIQRVDTANFEASARGGVGGNAIQAYKGTVSTPGELPREFINNARIKIQSSEGSTGDDYYVVFKTSNGGNAGVGTWEESVGPGVVKTIDESTLPHVIIREANGTFTFRELSESLANSTSATASVTGVPATVSIISTGNGRYAVGQSFPVFGGSGINLRLKVTSTTTTSTNTDFTWAPNPTNYIERIVYTNNTSVYNWYRDGAIFRITSTDDSFDIQNLTFSKLGSYTSVTPGDPSIAIREQAGLRITTVKTGVINGVSISRAGRGYTALNQVTNEAGDTFRIDTVATVTQNVDAVGKLFWKGRTVGDAETNPMPTFVGNQVHGISFFKNRLILTSGENVVCSQAGDYFNFFASTVITVVNSDPIDISCGSLKPIELRYSVQTPRGLVLFADNAQYILETTTDAFSSATAEINLLSNFNQSPRIAPVDTGSSIVFVEQGEASSTAYEMQVNESIGSKPAVVELTRTIPSYLPADIIDLRSTSSASTFALTTNREPSSIYFFRFFNISSSERVMASWFKWDLPGPISFFTFDQDIMHIVTKHNSDYVVSKVNLLVDSPGGSVFFDDKYVDLRLDLFNYYPTKVYDAVADETHICFKEGFNDASLQPVLVSLDPLQPGVVQNLTMNVDLAQPAGQKYFVTVEGNQTSSQFALGYQYIAEATLPAFYLSGSENRKDTLNIPMIHRMSIDSYNSGPYEVTIEAEGREAFTLTLPQIVGNLYQSNTVPMLRNARNVVPVLAKGDQVEVSISASSPFPTAFSSLTWEGTINRKGIKLS